MLSMINQFSVHIHGYVNIQMASALLMTTHPKVMGLTLDPKRTHTFTPFHIPSKSQSASEIQSE